MSPLRGFVNWENISNRGLKPTATNMFALRALELTLPMQGKFKIFIKSGFIIKKL
jgi:hypothetical protein